MIVDYNYKPYVAIVPLSAGSDTVYTAPYKNNKGFICIAGSYSGTTIGPKTITVYNPDGGLLNINMLNDVGNTIVLTGSLNDLYLQFSKEGTDSNAYDINFIRQATAKNESCFYPITYQSLTFPATAAAVTRPLIVISLY